MGTSFHGVSSQSIPSGEADGSHGHVSSAARLPTPESEKVLARRLRGMLGAQLCEANPLRAELIAGL
eukprot:3327365-Pleurochrysis_carterae.AAC.1